MSGTLAKKLMVGLMATTFTIASANALANDRHDTRYDPGYDENRFDDGYDYAKVVDVDPMITRVKVSTPQRECWDETRVDRGGYRDVQRSNAGGTLLGAVIGAA